MVAGKILCVHGGVGDGRWDLNDLRAVRRPLGQQETNWGVDGGVRGKSKGLCFFFFFGGGNFVLNILDVILVLV